MKRIILGIGLLCIVSFGLKAQDIHFSHMEFSPLTLNPALAGANYDLEASLNYRSQWNSVAEPFQTFGASFDMRLNGKNKENKTALFAVGVDFFNDRAGDAQIGTNHANVHFATHINLNRNNSLGAGIYGGYGQRTIDPSSSRWANQYNGMDYDPTLPTGENFNASSFKAFDMGAGLVYSYHTDDSRIASNDNKRINVGFAAYHLNQPDFSFLNHSSEQMYMRFSGFVNASFGIKNTHIIVEPGVYFQQQGNAREIFMGLYGKYIIKGQSQITSFVKQTTVGLGIFYRNQDALIAKAIVEWNGIGLGFAYDFNLFSSLLDVSHSKGGFEIALRWLVPDLSTAGTKAYF